MLNSYKPKFIVVEGLEGAGKSTAVSLIQHWLEKKGIKAITTREPGGTPIAEKLRAMVKAKEENELLWPLSELLLMYAARVQLVKNIIEPALKEGIWVIGDRHELSTRAYQGGGRNIRLESLETLHTLCLQNFKPDLTLYLDIPPALGLERIKNRQYIDRIEQESLDFFQRVRSVYCACVNDAEKIFKVDATQPVERVHTNIKAILEKYCV